MNIIRKHLLFTILAVLPTTLVAQPSQRDTLRQQTLKEVVVSANGAKQRLKEVQVGSEQLQLKELSNLPHIFGQADIMRSVQLLPGVKPESEASTGFQVRGGTAAQNQILYDDAPVYNVGHLAGLFSAFNEQALATATLYKGMIPAQLGGASSAVLDLTARTGNRSQWHGAGTIGLLAAEGAIEGPLLKNKATVIATARRSYMDVFLKPTKEYRGNTLYFYDMNVKADYQLTKRDLLLLTFFTGRDRTAIDEMIDLKWQNLTASLKWMHQTGDNSYWNTTLLYSGYNTDNTFDILETNVSYTGHIRQGGLRQEFKVKAGHHQLNIGLQSMLLSVKSAEWQQINLHEKEVRRAWENNLWVGDILELGKMTLSAGLRLNLFSPLGGDSPYYDVDETGEIIRLFRYGSTELVKTYARLEPRVSVNIPAAKGVNVKLGYTRTSQNIHALRNQNTSTPFDRYTLTSNLVKPEVADQVSAGIFAMTPEQDYDVSLEAYYRHVDDVVDFRDGKSFSSEIEIERLILPGQGRSYGVELCLRKNTGRLTGWLAYTLAWSETKIAGINGGRWYKANNDRRHDIDIVASYKLNQKWRINATWVYYSGQAFTAPSGKYELEDNWIYYYSERNGYRTPPTHRLDVGATFTKVTPKTHTTREWSFGIYNLYNRYNPYLINFEDTSDGARTKAVQYSLFGIVPSVAFTVKW